MEGKNLGLYVALLPPVHVAPVIKLGQFWVFFTMERRKGPFSSLVFLAIMYKL